MSSLYQNYIFEIPAKTNNSQTFIQKKERKIWDLFLELDFFQILFLLRLLGLFRVRSNFFPGFVIFF